jgi:phosphohistidine phosphatase SixA
MAGILVCALAGQAHASDEAAAWRALTAGGHVAVIRHTDAPGPPGDPAGFKLDDCSTQRNLSATGRKNAEAIGAAFRTRKIAVDRILSSAWCRYRDTARLLGLGPVETFVPLNNVYGRGGVAPEHAATLRDMIADWRGSGTLVMVSHGVVIGPLTGIYPGEGEVVVLAPKPGEPRGFEIVGRIPLSS